MGRVHRFPGVPFLSLRGLSEVADDKIGKDDWREILTQMKVWKTKSYFVYYKFFKLNSCGKRSAKSRRQFNQRLLKI